MPIQPSWVYPNVHFETDDLEKPWTFSHKFDFIHSRMLQTSIKDWDNYASQILKALNPGGRVELCEHILKTVHCDDGTGDESSALIKYMEVFREAMKKLGAHPDLQGEDLGEVLKKAGFVDVEVKTYKIAMGHWPKVKKDKRLGAMFGEVLRTGIDAYGMQVMTGLMGMTREEAEKMCNEARDVVLKSKEHWYAHFWTISGRKPAAGEA